MEYYHVRYILPKIPMMHACIKSRWVEEKMIWITAHDEGKTVTDIARSAKVTRDTVYKWLGRFELEGMKGLLPRKPGSVTGTHPLRIDHGVITEIIDLFENEDLRTREIGRRLRISHMTAYRHLIDKGKIKPERRRRRKKIPALHVCDFPGEELQLDVMHVDPLPGTEDKLGRSRKGFHYQYTLVDDCTRIQYTPLFPNLSQDNTCEFLELIISRSPFGFQKVRMDNGVEFQTKVKGFLQGRSINYIYNTPPRPDQNGKVERVHRLDHERFYLRDDSRTLEERRMGLARFLVYYNNERPHWGYGMDGRTPLAKLQSFREYQSVDLIV